MINLMMFTLVAVAVQSAATAPPPSIPFDLQAKFEDFLRDPASAQIRITSDLPESGSSERVLCGRYNAKNSYGGYVGFKDFVYLTSKQTLYSDGVAVRPNGTESLDEIMSHSPKTKTELDALSARGDALIAEVRGAFSRCVD